MHLSSSDIYDFLNAGATLERVFRRLLDNTCVRPLSQSLIQQFAINEQTNLRQQGIAKAPITTFITMLRQNSNLTDYLDELSQAFKLLIQKQIKKGEPISNAFQSDYELLTTMNALKVILIINRLDSLHSTTSFSLEKFEAIESELAKKLQYNIRLTTNIHNALTYMFYYYWEHDCNKNYQIFAQKCGFLFGFRKDAEENNWPVSTRVTKTTEDNFDAFTEIFELQPKLKGYIGDILQQLPIALRNIDDHIFSKFTERKRKNLAINGLAILAPDNQCGLQLVKTGKTQYQLVCPEDDKEKFILQHLLPTKLYELLQDPAKYERYQNLLKYYSKPENEQLYFDLFNDSYSMEYLATVNNFFIRANELLKLKPKQSNTLFFNSLLSYNNQNQDDRIEIIDMIANAQSSSHLLAMRELWFKNNQFLAYGKLKTSKHWTITPTGEITRISERNSRINLLCAIKLFLLLAQENQLPNAKALNALIDENPAFLFLKLARRTYISDLSNQTSSLYQTYCQYLDGNQSEQTHHNIIQYLNQRWHTHIEKINKKLKLNIDAPIDAPAITMNS
ncbi:MAG: hypothetical protein EP298_00370 [Gammaproteobacteria bacterium]|nr:MAG: hypothetical protein EP298_00370 [Gammaproteobacteria bacterium]UTW43001.1 hypothetical protein KFE69_02335 [bacterium SCSIO 12844]